MPVPLSRGMPQYQHQHFPEAPKDVRDGKEKNVMTKFFPLLTFSHHLLFFQLLFHFFHPPTTPHSNSIDHVVIIFWMQQGKKATGSSGPSGSEQRWTMQGKVGKWMCMTTNLTFPHRLLLFPLLFQFSFLHRGEPKPEARGAICCQLAASAI